MVHGRPRTELPAPACGSAGCCGALRVPRPRGCPPASSCGWNGHRQERAEPPRSTGGCSAPLTPWGTMQAPILPPLGLRCLGTSLRLLLPLGSALLLVPLHARLSIRLTIRAVPSGPKIH